MAMTDSLTGAHNRRYFMNHMRRELKRARRLGGDLSLLVCDIDHFKHINDRHGHAAGDDVLVEFVRRVQESLPREYDWCARMGGEEFAVVLPQTDLAGAGASRRRSATPSPRRRCATSAGNVEVTVSVGRHQPVGASRTAARRPPSRCCAAPTIASTPARTTGATASPSMACRCTARPRARRSSRLLYVDDDADIREIVQMSLSLDGDIKVLTSDGGERALLKMRVEQPDLVVLDVMMPGMDGPTLLKRMRADPELARIPVIFMTAKANPQEVGALARVVRDRRHRQAFRSDDARQAGQGAVGHAMNQTARGQGGGGPGAHGRARGEVRRAHACANLATMRDGARAAPRGPRRCEKWRCRQGRCAA